MQKRSRMPKDTNQLAALVVKMATGQSVESEPEEPPNKDPAAVELGRKGGLKGGKARWKGVSKKKRQELARKAALARWKKSQP
jgi:hypothetical protein